MATETKRKLSFIIPCYCSENSVRLVIQEIRETVLAHGGYDYEIIAVNDCSPDNTLQSLKDEAVVEPHLTVVDLARNVGRHGGLICGCRYASGDYVVFVDDDLQCPVDRLWDLLDPLIRGTHDVSFARYAHKAQSRFKNFGSGVNDKVATWLLGKSPDLKFSNFCAMKDFIKDEVIRYENPYPYMSGLMLRSTRYICNVDMEERERTIGEGHYNFRKSLSLWLNNFTSFSVKPLRMATMLGFCLAALGFLFAVYIVVRRLVDPLVAIGYSSTMAAILVVGGMIMCMIGLVGEYVGRIYISLNSSPQYVVRDVITSKEATRVTLPE